MMKLKKRGLVVAAVPVLLVLALAGAYASGVVGHQSGGAGRSVVAAFTERDVAVEIAVERDAAGKTWLAGRFTPTRPGFHLYGKDLPKGGIDGIGQPTLMEIVPSPALKAAGPLTADRATSDLHVPLLGLTFPVYPAGPVTLRQPVTVAGGAREAELSVTYMSCSESNCLAPAIGRRVSIALP
jgi:hypothetical protein